MIRRIIEIDEDKCNGCGACANACHEGAIAMVDGNAKLIRDDYCDGLGDCLPACPADAIKFVEREAAPYDEQAVIKHLQMQGKSLGDRSCPGSRLLELKPAAQSAQAETAQKQESQLRNWPVQIKLAPVNAPFLAGADLLIAADCTAFSCAAMHQDFMRGRVTLIGCPKLDNVDYSEKLTEIFARNEIKSITLARMEVPCCGGLVQAVKKALKTSGKSIPLEVVTISANGNIAGRQKILAS